MTTDSAGSFTLPCGPGALTLRATADGYRPREIDVACAEPIIIYLSHSIEIQGIVQRKEQPVSGVSVSCLVPGLISSADRTTTGKDGRFNLACLPGDLRLIATHPENAPVHLDLGAEVPQLVVIELEAPRFLQGRIVDQNGDPAAAEIVLVEEGNWEASTTVDADSLGRFKTAIKERHYVVGAIARDGRVATKEIEADSTDARVEMILPNGHSLRGRVVGDVAGDVTVSAFRTGRLMKGGPAAFRERLAAFRGTGGFQRIASSEANRFVFDHLESGSYIITASTPDARGEAEIDVPTDTELVLRVKKFPTLELSIVCGTEPAVGHVELVGDTAGIYLVRDGVFPSGRIPANVGRSVAWFVRDDGLVVGPTVIDVGPGSNHATLSADAEIELNGFVVDESGVPIEGASVAVAMTAADEHRSIGRVVQAKSDGSFSLWITDSATQLIVSASSYDTKVVEGHEGIRIELKHR